ncbi:sentrin-specific protease 1-like [Olea europaea var. sylvestris]|uniref:sentrin-specific protease 1-like n=1 Tax=Olea europaea var. sylvestris TaxID=158386 RepID=UPI000C1D7D84|nr:sentrin-specific protease 1-like [Olea europaea var. sylvestris]
MIKDIYPAFKKDPNVLLSGSRLFQVVTGDSITMSTPWADVDYVFMPLLPTNKAHWLLGLLEFRSHRLIVFNSAGKTYHDWKVLKGVEPHVKILPALMNALGISKKDPDYNGSGCMELKVTVDTAIPQQMNGHDCGVFVILYALYILRDGRSSITQKFDVAKCRLDIASLLYKHRETYVKNPRQATKGEGIVIE